MNNIFKKIKNPDVFIPVLVFIMIIFLILLKLFKSKYEKFSEYTQYGTVNNSLYSTEQPSRRINRSNRTEHILDQSIFSAFMTSVQRMLS